ncbi:hypothetical protein Tco_0290213 [Tanacetum coccineum]
MKASAANLILGSVDSSILRLVVERFVEHTTNVLVILLYKDISIGLILNGLTKDFVGFVRNYNMHNMGKTIGEIHAMLIEYEKGLPKKVETPQVMMIKSGKIQKANKKSLNAKGKNKVNGKGKDKKVYIPKPNNPKPTAKERPAKDDACHHCKEDLGEAAFILGIKIYRDRSKRLIGLCQNAYMDKILKRYKMDNSKRGSIMYAVRCTRPDVAFVQNMTSRFQQNPGEPHWTAVKNILKYLRNTQDMFLVYGGNPSTELRVECYCDAGFETDKDDTKSQTGYVFVLNGGAVD